MTKEEFEQRMKEIEDKFDNDVYDEEKAHFEADKLIMECLASLGYINGVAIFEQLPKWYA